ncbi:hypothetical protein GCL60_10095 [Silvanigrella paludirubra]|uniref:Uncharacterized protein n=1 Tax=Silvanigrella paludirubra TaxID=2499159 RepID=A0A6N6VVF4_9BACT|nr:hypothetical protein [Silvanigrella paludirubra]KAB8039194.1 hypothetical protein GCL60_10095 [Silvanigrella paludirubra]
MNLFLKKTNAVNLSFIIIFTGVLILILSLYNSKKTNINFVIKNIQNISTQIEQSIKNNNYNINEIIDTNLIPESVSKFEINNQENNLIKIDKNIYIDKLSKDNFFSIKKSSPILINEKEVAIINYEIPINFINVINLSIFTLLLFLFLIILYLNKNKELKNNKEYIFSKEFNNYLNKFFSHDLRKPFNLLKLYINNIEKKQSNEINDIILSEINKSIINIESFSTSILEYTENKNNNFKKISIFDLIEKIKIDLCLNSNFINNINNDNYLYCSEINLIKSFHLIDKYITKNIKSKNNYFILMEYTKIKKQNFLKIVFTFNGILIDKNDANKILAPFYLNKNNVNNNLDMVIVKKFIESHEGFITCNLKDKNVEILILIPTVSK